MRCGRKTSSQWWTIRTGWKAYCNAQHNLTGAFLIDTGMAVSAADVERHNEADLPRNRHPGHRSFRRKKRPLSVLADCIDHMLRFYFYFIVTPYGFTQGQLYIV